MTVEEKRQILRDICQTRMCYECPLKERGRALGGCYSSPVSDRDVETNYAILFDGEPVDEELENEPANDPVNPGYYNDSTIAPIDVIEDWDLDFCLGSALKYIKRAGKKANNPNVQDLRKVIWYVERRIKELEEARS